MKASVFAVLAACLLVFFPQSAHADAEAGENYFTGMISYIDDDDLAQLDDGVVGGQLGFGRALSELWDIEAYLMAAKQEGVLDQNQVGLGTDLKLAFARDSRITPYLFVGAGYLQIHPSHQDELDGLMLSAGAGFLADIFGDSDIALRGEYRLREYDMFGPDFRDNIVSLGLQMPFGEREPRVTDQDGDGVTDGTDRCPDTPRGAAVDEFGCETDSDGDGVANAADRCPDTPRGTRVGADGCPPDSDGDGVADDRDRCPNTARGASVDERGCELDEDGDGVVDRQDRCPGTARGVQVDVRGCEIKEEIRLPGVTFETNSDRLVPGAESVLNDAAATLVRNPSITVEVAGHTDSDGAAEYNEGLSERRAKTVRDYLAARGVEADRMTVRGYGESQPIADNGTAAGKAENRRVVLRILER